MSENGRGEVSSAAGPGGGARCVGAARAPAGAEGANLVDATMAWLVDRAQIRELTARYNRCFDDGDPEGFAATFTEDGVMEVDGGLPRRRAAPRWPRWSGAPPTASCT